MRREESEGPTCIYTSEGHTLAETLAGPETPKGAGERGCLLAIRVSASETVVLSVGDAFSECV
jgi:hypothetical protein